MLILKNNINNKTVCYNKVMKKIFLITLFLILYFLFSFAVNAKENKVKEHKNYYYLGSISSSFYDLNTFKYNSIEKTFSIDIFYELDAWHNSDADIKSPNDKNDIIYLIFATKYFPDKNKLQIKYKGFVSAKYIDDKTKQSGYKLSEIRIYYGGNYDFLSTIGSHIMDLRVWLSSNNDLLYDKYKKDVTQDIFYAYKKGSWKDLKYLKNSLEEF